MQASLPEVQHSFTLSLAKVPRECIAGCVRTEAVRTSRVDVLASNLVLLCKRRRLLDHALNLFG